MLGREEVPHKYRGSEKMNQSVEKEDKDENELKRGYALIKLCCCIVSVCGLKTSLTFIFRLFSLGLFGPEFKHLTSQ